MELLTVEWPSNAHTLASALARGCTLAEAIQAHALVAAECQEWLAKPEFAALVDSYVPSPEEIRHHFEKLAAPALKTLSDIMADQNARPGTRASIAKDLLDRAGFTAVKRVAVMTFSPSASRHQVVVDAAREAIGQVIADE